MFSDKEYSLRFGMIYNKDKQTSHKCVNKILWKKTLLFCFCIWHEKVTKMSQTICLVTEINTVELCIFFKEKCGIFGKIVLKLICYTYKIKKDFVY